MTESPTNQEGFGPPDEERIDSAQAQEQLDTDPEDVPNAPNRAPDESFEAAKRDPERRAKPAPADPEDRPGPLDPGERDPDLPTGVESYDRPGESGNWQPHGKD
jgi:hypothetical protein